MIDLGEDNEIYFSHPLVVTPLCGWIAMRLAGKVYFFLYSQLFYRSASLW